MIARVEISSQKTFPHSFVKQWLDCLLFIIILWDDLQWCVLALSHSFSEKGLQSAIHIRIWHQYPQLSSINNINLNNPTINL